MLLTKVSYSMLNGKVANVLDFGADPTGNTDSLQAFEDAIASFPGTTTNGGTVYVPAGKYVLSGMLTINKTIILTGDGTGYPSTGNFVPNSWLIFPTDSNGIYLDHSVSAGFPGSSLYSVIENLTISAQTVGTTGFGVWVSQVCALRNLFVTGFGSNGVHIVASTGSPFTGNANVSYIERVVSSSNGGSGFYIKGIDANVINFVSCDASSNKGYGYFDEGFLGNTYISCHAAGNLPPGNTIPNYVDYKTTNANAYHTFIGCYTEAGDSEIITPGTIIGGNLSNAEYLSATSTATSMGGGLMRRGGLQYLNESGSTPVGAGFGLTNNTDLVATTFGAQSENGGITGWKWKFDQTNNWWYCQYANNPSYEPIAYANSQTANINNVAGVLFQNGIYFGVRTAPIGLQSGAAAPTSGTYPRGSIVLNNAPDAGGTIGWVCVNAGTPGDWKTFGAISA